MSFGEELRNIMKAEGVKAVTLARRMGVSCAYISQLLTGIRKPGRETLLKLSKALEVPPERLLMIESDISLTTKIPRKVPVLHEAQLREWSAEADTTVPSVTSHIFEYAATDDPNAFYITRKGLLSCCGLDMCDLFLVEPTKSVENGNTVLVRTPRGFSIRKFIVRDALTVLVSDVEEPIVSAGPPGEDVKYYRVSQCIKKL